MLLKFIKRFQKYKVKEIKINGKKIKAIVAETSTKRTIGLMYTERLSKNMCMLFVFNRDGRHGIWMLNMKFSIDVLWLDSKKRIICLKENLKPCKGILNCEVSYPEKRARYIIELNSGYVKSNGLKVGSMASFNAQS